MTLIPFGPLFLLVCQIWWLNNERGLAIQKYSLSSAGKGKGKGKYHPRTGHQGPEGE
jgi:hypothetical protein